jgi:drug/metabolite transporter (DMT)-like permease
MASAPILAATTPASRNGARNVNLPLEIGLLTLLSAIWGCSFTLIKVAIDSVPAVTMVAARVSIAALLLALVVKRRGLFLPRDPRTWAAFLVQGLLQSALPFALISWGEKHIASGLAGVLNATPPMFVLLMTLAARHQGQRIGGQKILGTGLGLAGVLLIIGVQSLQSVGTTAPLAQGAVLGASLCYALAPMWGRRFAALPAIVTATGAMSCAAALTVPASLLLDRPWMLSPTPAAVAAVAVLAVICTAVAMIIYFRLLRTLGALGTTSGSYLRAGFSVVLGMLFLGESFTWSVAAGMVLIIVGTVAVTAPPLPRLGR